MERRIEAIEAGGIEALADPIMERWLSARFRAEKPEETLVWRNMLVRTTRTAISAPCAAIRDADLPKAPADRLARARHCAARRTAATPPDWCAARSTLIEGARFELIEGAGHLPCVEDPDKVAGLITGFLEENGIV